MSREQTVSAHISIGGAMKPSKLYSRDYNLLLSEEKKKKAEYLRQITEVDILKIKPIEYYPHAVRHNLSLFPNNHIELLGMKEEINIAELNADFLSLIEKAGCLERDYLYHRICYNNLRHKIRKSGFCRALHGMRLPACLRTLKHQFVFLKQNCGVFAEMPCGILNCVIIDIQILSVRCVIA